MIFTPINTGSAPNDGTGDTPRAAAQKINSGFEEVEARLHDQGEQIAYAKRSIDDVVALAQESAEAAAADRQLTSEDRDAVEAAAIAVAADRVQTGLDRTATHADAVSTAADRTAAAAAAVTATDKATIATTKAGEAAASATAAAGSATAAANSATAAAASAAIADRAAGGTTGQVQYNSGGVLTGSNGLNFDPATAALGVGVSSLVGYKLRLGGQLGGASAVFGALSGSQIQSGVSFAYQFISSASIAASVAMLQIHGFRAEGTGLGGGASVQHQYGFSVSSGLSQGDTGNYAYASDLAANGTRNWNLYFAGTAPSYLAGGLSIGAASDPGAGNARLTGRLLISDTATAPSSEIHVRKSTGDVNLTLQSDASGTTYINLTGPLVAYGGVRANNGASEEWRIGGLGTSGQLAFSLAGTERLKINSQSVTVGTTSAPGVALRVGGVIAATGAIRPGSFTVATLPSASGAGAGAQAFVTDASNTAYRAAVVGGGSDGVTVTSIGGQWLIGA